MKYIENPRGGLSCKENALKILDTFNELDLKDFGQELMFFFIYRGYKALGIEVATRGEHFEVLKSEAVANCYQDNRAKHIDDFITDFYNKNQKRKYPERAFELKDFIVHLQYLLFENYNKKLENQKQGVENE